MNNVERMAEIIKIFGRNVGFDPDELTYLLVTIQQMARDIEELKGKS